MLVLLTYLMNATRTGKAVRAVAEDTTTSSLLGIDTDRLILLTFVISGFVGGVTGTLIGLSVGIAGPYFGIAFVLKALAVIVLGVLRARRLRRRDPVHQGLSSRTRALSRLAGADRDGRGRGRVGHPGHRRGPAGAPLARHLSRAGHHCVRSDPGRGGAQPGRD